MCQKLFRTAHSHLYECDVLVGEGWHHIVWWMAREVVRRGGGDVVRFTCIKSKGGCLNVHYRLIERGSDMDTHMSHVIYVAREVSKVTCNVCGFPAVENDGYIGPRCIDHFQSPAFRFDGE